MLSCQASAYYRQKRIKCVSGDQTCLWTWRRSLPRWHPAGVGRQTPTSSRSRSPTRPSCRRMEPRGPKTTSCNSPSRANSGSLQYRKEFDFSWLISCYFKVSFLRNSWMPASLTFLRWPYSSQPPDVLTLLIIWGQRHTHHKFIRPLKLILMIRACGLPVISWK